MSRSRPAAGRRRCARGCRCRRARRARRARSRPRPSSVRDVGDERDRAAADLGRRRVDPLARRGRRSRPCTPSAASAAAVAKPSPCDAAATAARRPAIPRSIDRSSRRLVSGSGPALSRSDAAPPAGAHGDDLGADRRPRSPPGCGRRCRGRSAPCTRASSSSVDARLAQPLDPLGVRAPRAHRAEVADVGSRARRRSRARRTCVSWVSTHTASRGPRSSPTFAR